MRTLLISLVFLFVGSTVQADVPFLPTKLKITVLDDMGQHIDGATVRIYKTKEDYLNTENYIEVGKTDDKGTVQFKGLKPKPYFIEVQKDGKNNNGMGTRTDRLNEGKVNKVHVIIS